MHGLDPGHGRRGRSRLEQAEDAGNGFLLASGYTLVWAGWQADAPPSPGMQIEVPTVPGMTGPSREEFTSPAGPDRKRVTLSYPVADPASASSQSTPAPTSLGTRRAATKLRSTRRRSRSPRPGRAGRRRCTTAPIRRGTRK